MPRTDRPGLRRSGGFTLLEMIAALAIIAITMLFSSLVMVDSYDQSLGAQNARILRMLAERKLGEIAVFERHFDANEAADFSDLPEEIRDEYDDWEWETEIRDVTVFGTQTDPNADYLFESADPTTEGTLGGTATGAEAAKKKGDTQMLREVVLRVKAPSEEGEGELVEIVTYLPQVPVKTAAGAPAPAPAGDGK